VKAVGYLNYLNEQFSMAPTNVAKGSNYPDLVFPAEDGSQCPVKLAIGRSTVCTRDIFSSYPIQRTFFSNSLYGPDQLRQRVAFALHQIVVVSAKR
jgi:hypothetical protein